jgi:hypothetical protein
MLTSNGEHVVWAQQLLIVGASCQCAALSVFNTTVVLVVRFNLLVKALT